ncbi:MAG TPA: sigma-70 family RNA polymerase sigma factor [Baekduia sp.]
MSRVGERDDEVLLAAAAGGDDQAFEEFYRRHLAAVTGFHLRRTGRRDLAFDLTAETFAAVVVALHTFDPARGSAGGWLFGIAGHKLADALRRGRVEADARRRLRHEPVALEDEDLARVEELASLVNEARLATLLGDLPTDQRAALLARVVDEQSYEAIAATLDCSEAVVRQRVHRGLRRLRSGLEARHDRPRGPAPPAEGERARAGGDGGAQRSAAAPPAPVARAAPRVVGGLGSAGGRRRRRGRRAGRRHPRRPRSG